MKNTKDIKDFLSTLDSIQIRFRNSIAVQQRVDKAEQAQRQATIEQCRNRYPGK